MRISASVAWTAAFRASRVARVEQLLFDVRTALFQRAEHFRGRLQTFVELVARCDGKAFFFSHRSPTLPEGVGG
jgi:hypothetical protein